MKLLRMTLRAALRALRRNKMRSVLTMLGIIIGVAAVIAMVSIGQGADAAVQKQIRSLGTELLMVVPGATTSTGVRSGCGRRVDAHRRRRDGDQEGMSGGEEVSATSSARSSQVVYGDKNWSTAVQGAPPSFFSVRDWPVVSGSIFTDRDERRRGARCGARPDGGRATLRHRSGSGRQLGADQERAVPRRRRPARKKGRRRGGRIRTTSSSMPFSTAERRVLGTEFLGTVDKILVDGDLDRRDRTTRPSRSPRCCASATASKRTRTTTSRCATSTTSPARRRWPAR